MITDRIDVKHATEMLSAIASPVRLRILIRLCKGEISAGELTREMGVSPSALSQHLAILRTRKMVRTRRRGHIVYYSRPFEAVLHILAALNLICSDYRDVQPRSVARTLQPHMHL